MGAYANQPSGPPLPLTLTLPKQGLCSQGAVDLVGELSLADIGYSQDFTPTPLWASRLTRFLRRRLFCGCVKAQQQWEHCLDELER